MAWSDWQGVIGALGGVAITGTIGLITAKLTHRWQREAREESRRGARGELRRAAYAAHLVQSQRVIDETASWMDHTGKHLSPPDRLAGYAVDLADSTHQHDACERHAMLAAGPHVKDALAAYRAWFRQAVAETLGAQSPGFSDWETQEKPLLEAMTKELDEDMAIRGDLARPWWKSWTRSGGVTA